MIRWTPQFDESQKRRWSLHITVVDGKKQTQRATLKRIGYLDRMNFMTGTGQSVEVEPIFEPPHFFEKWTWSKRESWCLAGAILTHMILAVCLTSSLASKGIDRLRADKIPDVSKVIVSNVNSIPQSGGPVDPAALENRMRQREMAKASRLMKDWGVGKPIQSANQVLKPSLFDKAFAKSGDGSSKLGSWSVESSIDEDRLTKPLNLSEQEVAETLRKVNPILRECYNDILIRDSTLRGKPQIILDISDLGRIRGVNLVGLQGRTNSLSDLRSCFLRAYQSVSLRKPNQSFTVAQTMVLDY